MFKQKIQLLGGLRTFGNHVQAEIVSQGYNGCHNRSVVSVSSNTLNKRAINLDRINGKATASGLATSSSARVNSSPPRRATVSLFRTQLSSLSATMRNN